MSLLAGTNVVQLGPGRAAAVCGRLFADTGATIMAIGATGSTPHETYLNDGKQQVSDADAVTEALSQAELIVCEGTPAELSARHHDAKSLREQNDRAAIVLISSFGQTGPRANEPACDLTLFFASGISRLLTGQVDELAEAPMRPVGGQSAYIGGLAAACAGMHALLSSTHGATVDVSIQEALATLAVTELARGGLRGQVWSRKRIQDGNGATVTILPAKDGYVAISPREERQWTAWLEAMGSPDWGDDPRFARMADRIENWDALHALMSEWSRRLNKQEIANRAQASHVPSFPLQELAEQLTSPQLEHRKFFRSLSLDERSTRVPSAPFRLHDVAGEPNPDDRRKEQNAGGSLPLSGIRVLDFSWVIAGPTATRYLAAMGAEVIKIEAPGRGDPGRVSELHTVLGQAKKGIVLDLKTKDGVQIARDLAGQSDVLIENFATGVMERLGLGADKLQRQNPNLIYLSASGLGRTGPEARSVAYGTLLQCYAGFAGLNRHPDRPPRVGFAWLDPMCGLMLPFAVAAALRRRDRHDGRGVRLDFSMIEAMLWTMAEPLIAAQSGNQPEPVGNSSTVYAPHGVYRCIGEDSWIAVAAVSDKNWTRLCELIPALSNKSGLSLHERQDTQKDIDAAVSSWAASQDASSAAAQLLKCGIPASALATSADLAADPHLLERGFWDAHREGVLPGLPWRTSFGRKSGPAPELGADTVSVLNDVLHLSDERISELRNSGALGD